jgi:hypothetical protein
MSLVAATAGSVATAEMLSETEVVGDASGILSGILIFHRAVRRFRLSLDRLWSKEQNDCDGDNKRQHTQPNPSNAIHVVASRHLGSQFEIEVVSHV